MLRGIYQNHTGVKSIAHTSVPWEPSDVRDMEVVRRSL